MLWINRNKESSMCLMGENFLVQHVFQLSVSSMGQQEPCHVAHTGRVVLCDWIPTSGPKKQTTRCSKIGKT